MKSSVWNRIVLPVLFALVIALGLAQGDSFVMAITDTFTPYNYQVNDTVYTNQGVRCVSTYPLLKDSYEVNNVMQYLWEVSVSVNTSFPADNDYYCEFTRLQLNMEYPSNADVIQSGIFDYNNTDGYNVSLYSQSVSSANHNIRGYFRIEGKDKWIYKNSSYSTNLVNFTVLLRTNTDTSPQLSITDISTNIKFSSGNSYVDMIIQGINESETAEDIADILTNSDLTLTEVRNIATALGVANNHLSYIQEYAFEIWTILQTHLSTQTESDFADAETKVEDIIDNMEQYNPSKPNSQQLQSDAQNRYIQLQQEEQNDSIFFYLNWAYLLPILLLVFTFAILSYILYGGK